MRERRQAKAKIVNEQKEKELNEFKDSIPLGHKFCTTCKTIKSIDNFGVLKTSEDGLSNRCKSCSKNVIDRTKTKYNEDRKNKDNSILFKKCSCCGETKSIKYFCKHSNHKDGYSSKCELPRG